MLARFGRRELDVLVGTQMIAKGHDFPSVTLVGVVSADVGLGLPDFRAAERTFQLITQVVGRAGRGERAGEAIVQTLFPEHYAVRCGSAQDYDAFVAKELEYRTALRYPPMTAMVNVVVRGAHRRGRRCAPPASWRARPAPPRRQLAWSCSARPRRRWPGCAASTGRSSFSRAASAGRLREAMRAALAAHPALARRTAVDVDPVSML